MNKSNSKRKNEVTISEAIRYFIREHGMEQRILDSMVLDAWDEQMGDFMKNYTERIFVKNRTLFVAINNPSLKNELSYGKNKIISHINNYIDEEYITDVKFL